MFGYYLGIKKPEDNGQLLISERDRTPLHQYMIYVGTAMILWLSTHYGQRHPMRQVKISSQVYLSHSKLTEAEPIGADSNSVLLPDCLTCFGADWWPFPTATKWFIAGLHYAYLASGTGPLPCYCYIMAHLHSFLPLSFPSLLSSTPFPSLLTFLISFLQYFIFINVYLSVYLLFFVGMVAQGEERIDAHCMLQGYIMGYLIMLTGHRSVVLTNMTREHVRSHDSWKNGARFQILVSIYFVDSSNDHLIS